MDDLRYLEGVQPKGCGSRLSPPFTATGSKEREMNLKGANDPFYFGYAEFPSVRLDIAWRGNT